MVGLDPSIEGGTRDTRLSGGDAGSRSKEERGGGDRGALVGDNGPSLLGMGGGTARLESPELGGLSSSDSEPGLGDRIGTCGTGRAELISDGLIFVTHRTHSQKTVYRHLGLEEGRLDQ